jgi:anti-anti-sigma factor
MEIEYSERDGCVVVAFRGQIDLVTVAEVQRVLLKALSEQPFAVICDLSGVDELDPVFATVFSTVANHPSSRWPATSLLLCSAQPGVAEILGHLRMPHFLRLHADLEEALEQALTRQQYLRDELGLAPTLTAPATARRFVDELCRDWQLTLTDRDLADRAVLVADELVTNAVLHARTDIRLRVELSGDRLQIAVHDQSPRLLRLVRPDPEAESGRGLQMVELVAKTWGIHHHPDGGKVVWCILDL